MITRSARWHFDRFADFARKVQAISGATPHLITVGASAREVTWDQKLWRGGLYAATYNYPAAELLWQTWRTPALVLRDKSTFAAWVAQHWRGLPLRRERKAVNAPARLAACILSFAEWAVSAQPRTLCSRTQGYDDCWREFTKVQYMGRYIAIRFLEYMRRYAELPAEMYDSRPAGGRYPRQGLALLYPKHKAALLGGDGWADCEASNDVAVRCLVQLREQQLYLTHYELQSLICEYKQAALGGKQYPVQALDSELGYYARVAAYWGEQYTNRSQFFDVRSATFQHLALGELQGWPGKRKALGGVLRDYGYNWSDLVYDYNRTEDFARPVMRCV